MILLMGLPGSGKGTQGKLLSATRGYHIISTGELLRNYGSAEQHERMKAGEILGDAEVTELLDKALGHLEDQNKTILDGYPRTIKQTEWLTGPDNGGRFKVDYAVYLNASQEAVTQRLLARGRPDDTAAAVAARFKEYEQATLPIINHLRAKGIEVIEVNAERPAEEVHREIIKLDRRKQAG